MTPLQEFRYWARRAPVSERAVAGIAGAIVVALLAWLLVPGPAQAPTEVVDAGTAPPQQVVAAGAGPEQPGGGEETVTTNPAATGSTVPATAARPAGPGRSEVAQSAGGGPAATLPADNGGCVSPPGSARGITPSEIRIAVTLTNIVGPAANSVFGVATPDEQRAWYEAVIGAINASGGVACRKLVPRYFPANPADQNNLQQTCLDIAEAGVFAEIDNGSYANYPQKQCFAQHQIPYFGAYFLTRSEKERFYPYLFNMAEYDTLARNTILGLRQRGFFDPAAGFKKLGFLYHDCDKGLVDTALTAIAQAGVPSSQLVTYNVGCPTTFASPADLAQAVLRFRQSGVTHVSFVNFVGDFSNFTNVAEQQGFRPRYGVPDEALIDISYGSQRPNAANIAGAIAITAYRSGEERTPGMTPSPGTAKCDAIYRSQGLPPTYRQPAGAGHVCSQLWMFQAAVNNAPVLSPAALAAGLQRARSLELSYPAGPNDFTGPKATTGGQFWRAAQFMGDCSCWRVVDATFRPSFP
jgi:hypothetical protein